MVQELIIIVFFAGALFYLSRLIYNQFQAKSACQTGCAKCGAVDFAKIEAELKSKNL